MKKMIYFFLGFLFTTSILGNELINNWQGEWGNWVIDPKNSIKSNIKYQGASISISHCDENKKSCNFRFDYKFNRIRFCISGSLAIVSDKEAVGTYDDFFRTRTIKFTRNDQGAIQIESPHTNSRPNNYSYTKGFISNYPLRSHLNFSGYGKYPATNRIQICYNLPQSPLLKTWCTNPEIFQLDETANALHDKVTTFSTGLPRSFWNEKQFYDSLSWRDRIIKTCNQSKDETLACLKKEYTQWITLLTQVEKEQLLAAQAEIQRIQEPGNSDKAFHIIDQIVGVYRYNLSGQDKDKLEITRAGKDTIHLRAQFKHDICNFNGIAKYNREGDFFFTDNNEDSKWDVNNPNPCIREIIPTQGGLAFGSTSNCKTYCDDFVFKNDSKQKLTY